MSHPSPVVITPDFTPSTPTAPGVVSGDFVAPIRSALLDPTGDDNSILLTGDGASTASITIEEDSIELSVAETDGNVVVTSGDKRRMIVTADFGDGLEVVDLVYVDEPFTSGGRFWSSTGDEISTNYPTHPQYQVVIFDGTGDAYLEKYRSNSGTDTPFFEIASGASGLFPDEIDWSTAIKFAGTGGTPDPVTPTGTPTVVASPAAAAQAINAINADSSLPVIAANAPGSDGSGAIAAVAPVAFAGIDSPSVISNDWTPQTPSAPPSIGT